jgi:hypothetical protein
MPFIMTCNRSLSRLALRKSCIHSDLRLFLALCVLLQDKDQKMVICFFREGKARKDYGRLRINVCTTSMFARMLLVFLCLAPLAGLLFWSVKHGSYEVRERSAITLRRIHHHCTVNNILDSVLFPLDFILRAKTQPIHKHLLAHTLLRPFGPTPTQAHQAAYIAPDVTKIQPRF